MGDDSGGTYLTTSIIKLNLDVSSVLIYEIITKNMTSIKKTKSIFLNKLWGSVRGDVLSFLSDVGCRWKALDDYSVRRGLKLSRAPTCVGWIAASYFKTQLLKTESVCLCCRSKGCCGSCCGFPIKRVEGLYKVFLWKFHAAMQSVHVDHEQRGQSSAASVTTDFQPPIWEQLCIFTLNRQLQMREEETKALILTCDCSAYSNSFTLPTAKKKSDCSGIFQLLLHNSRSSLACCSVLFNAEQRQKQTKCCFNNGWYLSACCFKRLCLGSLKVKWIGHEPAKCNPGGRHLRCDCSWTTC